MFHNVFSGTDPIKFSRFSYSLNRLQFSQVQPFIDSWSEPLVILTNCQSFMVGLRQILLHAKNMTFSLKIIIFYRILLSEILPIKNFNSAK